MEKLVSPLKILRNAASFVYDTEEVGPKIGALRISKGLSPQDLAEALCVPVERLEGWENGEVEVILTDTLRKKICKVFGLTVLQFKRHFEWKDLDERRNDRIRQKL